MKRIFLYLPIFLFFLINTTVNGQSVKEKYQKESIYLQTGFFSGLKYIKNGDSHHIGLFNDDLKKEMKFSKSALTEYNRYTKNRNTGLILYLTGTAMAVSGFIMTLDDFNSTNKNFCTENILMISGIVVDIVSGYFLLKSNNNLHKAVWLHNKDLLEL